MLILRGKRLRREGHALATAPLSLFRVDRGMKLFRKHSKLDFFLFVPADDIFYLF